MKFINLCGKVRKIPFGMRDKVDADMLTLLETLPPKEREYYEQFLLEFLCLGNAKDAQLHTRSQMRKNQAATRAACRDLATACSAQVAEALAPKNNSSRSLGTRSTYSPADYNFERDDSQSDDDETVEGG